MENKAIVIGCARSGIGAAKLAAANGYQVTLYDQKPIEQFNDEVQKAVKELEQQGVTFISQEAPVLSQYDKVILSPGVPTDLPFIQEAIEGGQDVVGELEFAASYCKAPIVAITGTNGKTTTTALVGQIIKAYNEHTYVVGNIGRAFSEDVSAIPADGIAVAEVSSFQLEMTKTFHPRVAALLNITPDHLNRHKTMANYCEAKYQVAAHQSEVDYFVLNANDPYYEEAKTKSKARMVTFNAKDTVDYGTFAREGILYENMSGEETALCAIKDLKILGNHNVENALAAIALCKGIGVPNAVIIKELLAFSGVAHRIEYITTKKGVAYYNDSKATNVDAAITGVLAMEKPIHLIAGGMDKKTTFEDWIKLFKGRVKKVYVIGETKEQIISECHAQGFDAIEAFDSFEAAIQGAYGCAQSEECVLLSPACASWDMFESFEQRGDLFREFVNQLEG
ncbi:MAG: UDP-N-acetylmuramoyl-L-alanine--D-glutamate ligase [Cellulosilyticaceae bacterium]